LCQNQALFKFKGTPTSICTKWIYISDDVAFGEVAMAPPLFTAKPRKADSEDSIPRVSVQKENHDL